MFFERLFFLKKMPKIKGFVSLKIRKKEKKVNKRETLMAWIMAQRSQTEAYERWLSNELGLDLSGQNISRQFGILWVHEIIGIECWTKPQRVTKKEKRKIQSNYSKTNRWNKSYSRNSKSSQVKRMICSICVVDQVFKFE